MSLSYRLYQIGYDAGPPQDTSGIKEDSGTDLQTDISTDSSDWMSYWEMKVGDASVFPSTFENNPYLGDKFYIQIDNEIIEAQRTVDLQNFPQLDPENLLIGGRGMFGTQVESHNSGADVYLYTTDAPEEDLQPELSILEEVPPSQYSVLQLGEVEEVIENKKGNFRIDNLSVTLSGIGRERLRDAGDFQKPWVFEVYDSSDQLQFQGLIQNDAKFNASTEKTSFTAVSWLEILDKAGNVPARTIYEGEVAGTKIVDRGDSSFFAIDIPEDVEFTDDFPDRGDTVAFDTDKGEVRRLIRDVLVSEQAGLRRLILASGGEFENVLYNSKGEANSTVQQRDKKVYHSGFTGGIINVDVYGVDNEEAADAIQSAVSGDIDIVSPVFPFAHVITFDSDDNVVQRLPIDKSSVSDVEGKDRDEKDLWPRTFLAEYSRSSVPDLEPHDYFMVIENTGATAPLARLNSAERGDTIRILGQEAWGYAGAQSNGMPLFYKTDDLIEALTSVNDISAGQKLLGVLPDIVDDVILDSSAVSAPVLFSTDPRVEFPEKPIEAVRMIQQNSGTLLFEERSTKTNTNGDQIPSVVYKLRTRSQFFNEDNEALLDRVVDWKENITENRIDAVVVTTNEQYGGGGDDIPEAKGWYYAGIDSDESTDKPQFTGVPEGENVIEIETNLFPVYDGQRYSGSGEEVINDSKLKSAAEFYYRHFTRANREVELTVGRDNPDVLGKYVSFNEGPIVDDAVLITKKTHDLREGYFETTLHGRIGGRARETVTIPQVELNGPRSFQAQSDNTAVIRMSGVNSWDAAPGDIEYEWKVRPKDGNSWGSVSLASTAGTLDYEVTGITSRDRFDVRLKVTNARTGQSSTEERVVVIEPYKNVSTERGSREVDFSKSQVIKSDTKFGRLEIRPKTLGAIKQDGNDNFLVQYIARSGGEIDADPEVDSNWTTVGGSDAQNVDSEVLTTNGEPSAFRVDLKLAKKHVSNVLIRIQWTTTSGFQNLREPFSFDLDNTAEVELSLYTDNNGVVYADIAEDIDTDNYDVSYDLGSGFQAVGNYTTGQNGLQIYDALADGEQITVKVEPYNSEGVLGEVSERAVFHNRLPGDQYAEIANAETITANWTFDSSQGGQISFTDGTDNTFDVEYDESGDYLAVRLGGTDLFWIDADGAVYAKSDVVAFASGAGSGGSTNNSRLAVLDETGTVLTQDAKQIQFSGGVTVTEPNSDEILVDVAGKTTEEVQDDVAALLSGGTGINLTYDDAGDTLTIDGTAQYTDADAIAAINNDSDHGSTASHNYYTDSDAISAINNDGDHGSTASHNYYTDSDAVSAINNDTDHGSTASHNYFSGSHSDLSGITSDDHHTRYSDSEARSAVDGASIDISGDADTVDGYEGADLAALAEDETITGRWVFNDRIGFGTSSPNAAVDIHNDSNSEGEHGLVASAQYGAGDTYIARFDYRRPGDASYDTKAVIRTDGNAGFGGKTDPQHEVDVDGRTRSTDVEATDTLQVGGWTLQEDSTGDLIITSPSGNEVRLGDDGDVEAFNNA
jgi:hypothetical protein